MIARDVIFVGPELSDTTQWESLPEDYRRVLVDKNGFVAYRGGFHLRGICDQPEWHALKTTWSGPFALHSLFSTVQPGDIPFGQDCLGDQFLLREAEVYRLSGETGEAEFFGFSLNRFLAELERDAVNFLKLEPLLKFELEGGRLGPDQSLSVYPPFAFAESANGISLRPVPKLERIRFLADLARQLANVKDGETIEMKLVE